MMIESFGHTGRKCSAVVTDILVWFAEEGSMGT